MTYALTKKPFCVYQNFVQAPFVRKVPTDTPSKASVEIRSISLFVILDELTDAQGVEDTKDSGVVQQALITRYLTVEAENKLRQLLRNKYDSEDYYAFMKLQQATMSGLVKQFRELSSIQRLAKCFGVQT